MKQKVTCNRSGYKHNSKTQTRNKLWNWCHRLNDTFNIHNIINTRSTEGGWIFHLPLPQSSLKNFFPLNYYRSLRLVKAIFHEQLAMDGVPISHPWDWVPNYMQWYISYGLPCIFMHKNHSLQLILFSDNHLRCIQCMWMLIPLPFSQPGR